MQNYLGKINTYFSICGLSVRMIIKISISNKSLAHAVIMKYHIYTIPLHGI